MFSVCLWNFYSLDFNSRITSILYRWTKYYSSEICVPSQRNAYTLSYGLKIWLCNLLLIICRAILEVFPEHVAGHQWIYSTIHNPLQHGWLQWLFLLYHPIIQHPLKPWTVIHPHLVVYSRRMDALWTAHHQHWARMPCHIPYQIL